MWKNLTVLSGIAVKWQHAFSANKREIMHMGKNKPGCTTLKMGFKPPLTTQGRQLGVAVSNSKKCWRRAEHFKRADRLSEIAREDTENKIIILLCIHLLITARRFGLPV